MPEKIRPLPVFLSISLQIPFPAYFILKYSHSPRTVSIDREIFPYLLKQEDKAEKILRLSF